MERTVAAHNGTMSTVITNAIKLAFPDSRAKRVAIALGCSFMTAKRIWASGKVSQAYRRQLIEVLDEELARNELAIRRLRAELRAGTRHEETNRTLDADSLGTLRQVAQGCD